MDAQADTDLLRTKYQQKSKDFDTNFINGYNQSHLDGNGDIIQSIFQTFNSSASDFDRDTILNQIHSQVTTRKILLVGHSQGTFYTNSLYEYLTQHGVPASSIAVFNLATPAHNVAGGGAYLTSANDHLVNAVRELDAEAGAPAPLEANVLIPIPASEANDQWAGHHFQSDYLSGAPDKIVSDIQKSLGKLVASGAPQSDGSCFAAPGEGLKYETQAVAFKVADPLAVATDKATSAVGNTVGTAAAVVGAGISNTQAVIGDAVSNAFFSVVPRPNAQTAAAAFGVVSALYGSSLNERDVQDLFAGGNDNAPTPQEQQTAALAAAVSGHVETSGAAPHVSSTPTATASPSDSTPSPRSPSLGSASQGALMPTGTSPGYGGGGAAPADTSSQSSQQQQSQQPAAVPVTLDVTSPLDDVVFATTSVAFSGTTASGAVVTAVYANSTATTTADAVGGWSLSISLVEGTTPVDFSATDNNGTVSNTVTRNISIDLTPTDAPVIALPACGSSLSSAFCLLATTTAALAWNDVTGAAHYRVVLDGVPLATTTATTTNISIAFDATTTVAVVAYDAAGNSATSSSSFIRGVSQPLLINEIAWAGSDAPADQWIEIKNTTPYTLDLSRVALARSLGSTIQLSGVLAGTAGGANNNILVIEPRDINPDWLRKIIVPFTPLAAAGEQLSLVWGDGVSSTTIDSTPMPGTCGGWCAGAYNIALGTNAEGLWDPTSSLSMERRSNATDGTLASSWQSTDGYGQFERADNRSTSWGTPDVENSAGYPTGGWVCNGTGAAVANSGYNPGSGYCTYLMRFVSATAPRSGGVFRGDIASSTSINSFHYFGKALAAAASDPISNPQPGEHFFTAIWEDRVGPAFNDDLKFEFYFTQGASSTLGIFGPPHDNYIVIPWTYQP